MSWTRSPDRLEQAPGRDILVAGSGQLVQALAQHQLVDEYRLMVFRIVLGSGKRLFRDEADTNHLRLVDARTFASGIVLLTYEPVAEAPAGKFTEAYSWTREQVEGKYFREAEQQHHQKKRETEDR